MTMSFMKKEDRERVERLNEISGTRHRTKPYDWNNPEDIIEAVTMITAEFVDLSHLDATLGSMEGDLDEMIEYYHPQEWMKMTSDETWGTVELQEAVHSLASASSAMRDLVDVMHENLQDMLSFLFFTASQAVRDHFFTPGWEFDADVVKTVLNIELGEVVFEIEYDGVIQHSASRYMSALEATIKQGKKPSKPSGGGDDHDDVPF